MNDEHGIGQWFHEGYHGIGSSAKIVFVNLAQRKQIFNDSEGVHYYIYILLSQSLLVLSCCI